MRSRVAQGSAGQPRADDWMMMMMMMMLSPGAMLMRAVVWVGHRCELTLTMLFFSFFDAAMHVNTVCRVCIMHAALLPCMRIMRVKNGERVRDVAMLVVVGVVLVVHVQWLFKKAKTLAGPLAPQARSGPSWPLTAPNYCPMPKCMCPLLFVAYCYCSF